MLYFAYGSNLNLFQMKRRCKDSVFVKGSRVVYESKVIAVVPIRYVSLKHPNLTRPLACNLVANTTNMIGTRVHKIPTYR